MPSSYLLINRLRYHYLYWNLENGRQPLLLLHGLASNARIWEKVAPYLAENGLALYAPDLRGHGLTDKPEGDYGFETYARDLAAFAEACDLKSPVVVGHSWGAMLAVDYAARYAIGPRAPSAVVLVDGGFLQLDDSPGATWEDIQQRLTPPRLAGTPLAEFMSRLAQGYAGWKPDEASIQAFLANFEIAEDDTISPHLTFEHHMQIVRAMWEFKTYERFMRLLCPVLALPARPAVMNDAEGAAFLAFKESALTRLQKQSPHLQVCWMENAVHDLPLQKPAELSKVILEFLAGK